MRCQGAEKVGISLRDTPRPFQEGEHGNGRQRRSLSPGAGLKPPSVAEEPRVCGVHGKAVASVRVAPHTGPAFLLV